MLGKKKTIKKAYDKFKKEKKSDKPKPKKVTKKRVLEEPIDTRNLHDGCGGEWLVGGAADTLLAPTDGSQPKKNDCKVCPKCGAIEKA